MESLKRIRKRQGRCYELAGKAMIAEAGADQFVLVHGVVHYRGAPIGHAWILTPDGQVYDPVAHEYLPASEYVEQRQAIEERRYSKVDAARMVRQHRHWGPWHNSGGGWLDMVAGGLVCKMANKVTCESDGEDIFIVWDGIKIAKRGHPGTPQAKTWIALEPGYKVTDIEGGQALEIEHCGVRIH